MKNIGLLVDKEMLDRVDCFREANSDLYLFRTEALRRLLEDGLKKNGF